jgi:hypothetical protein
MVDPLVQRLLEQAVDTPVKLQLLLMFYENPRMEATPHMIAERVFRDIWSVAQGLHELAANGIILQAAVANGDPIYRYNPSNDYRESIASLITGYDDPFVRDVLHHTIRNLPRYSPMRPLDPWESLVA